jgi:formylglycine-generating enzyme
VRTALALPLLLAGCAETAPPARACAAVGEADMAWVPGGELLLGAEARLPEEGPPRRVRVAGFWMSTHEVTMAEFARFVAATGYRTVAERVPDKGPPELCEPGSAVFTAPAGPDPRWWRWQPGASWRRPAGPGGAASAPAEPVVHIAYEDALAYARWRGLALPSEAQWERAARLGGVDVEQAPPERPVANHWQGPFPVSDLASDGYPGRAPVGCFPRDRAGLYDMIGNVWEWTRDAAGAGDARGVIKGGSWLCADNYCARYRPAARQFQERGLGTDHIGFRLVDEQRPPPPGAKS